MSRRVCCSRMLTAAGLAVLMVGCWACLASDAKAEWIRRSAPGDVSINYYVPPVGENSVGAKLYVSPRPVPAWVGHTYITYPPLAPHEFLYPHHRTYRTFHDDAPPTRTSVRWCRW